MSATQQSGFILLSHLSCSPAILFTKRGRPGRWDSQQGEIREGLLGKFHLHTNAGLGAAPTGRGAGEIAGRANGLGKSSEDAPGQVGADEYLGVGPVVEGCREEPWRGDTGQPQSY